MKRGVCCLVRFQAESVGECFHRVAVGDTEAVSVELRVEFGERQGTEPSEHGEACGSEATAVQPVGVVG